VALAPLAVEPSFQSSGIGGALIREGHVRLKEAGETLSVVLGDPAYYGRFKYSHERASGFDSVFQGEALQAHSFGRCADCRHARLCSSLRRAANSRSLMPRYRLDIEYDGSAYAGWQRQADQPSVQQAIERAIQGFCGETVSIRGAGRTDAGVHATWPGRACRSDQALGGRHRARRDQRASGAVRRYGRHSRRAQSSDDFDARFSATARHYLYRIVNRRARLAIDAQRAWWVPKPLDAAAMHAAAQVLVGRHDFTTFRSIHCQAKSPCARWTGLM
jgi:tRNA pseudouridine(38-40) synthase